MRSGLSALELLITAKQPRSSSTNHTQPEPNLPFAAS
jgi:hypothetical protein